MEKSVQFDQHIGAVYRAGRNGRTDRENTLDIRGYHSLLYLERREKMSKEDYDQDEMEMRELAFEAAKLTSMARALAVMVEWKKLKKEDELFETKYPAITEIIKGNQELLDPNSFGNKMIFNNPLMKLAMISQKPPANEEKENSDSEKSPG